MKKFLLLLIVFVATGSCDVEDVCRAAQLIGTANDPTWPHECFYRRHLAGRENNPRAYLDAFVADAARYGIDVSHVYNGTIRIEFGDARGYNARVKSGCNDSRVWVIIDRNWWDGTNFGTRLGTMYHEFGHDILNMDHSDRGLMTPRAQEQTALDVVGAIRDFFLGYNNNTFVRYSRSGCYTNYPF